MPFAKSRLIAMLLALTGALVATDPTWLLFGWGLGIAGLACARSAILAHAKFVIIVLMPILSMLWIIWVWLLGAPPGAVVGSDPQAAWVFVARTATRLGALSALLQAGFLTISPDQLGVTLRRWGLTGDGLIVILGAYVIGPELALRAEQIYIARLARGVVTKRGAVGRALQLPSLLVPLFAWTLRAAVHRADVWQERLLVGRLNVCAMKPEVGSVPTSIAVIAIASAWCAGAMLQRLGLAQ